MSLNDFVIMKLLGKGSFGSVFLVKRKKDDQIYAMKRINLPKSPMSEKEAALNEIRLLASLSHPNIIGYKETFCDISTGDLCIVMEYGDGGDLAKRIQFNKTNHLLFEENMIWKWIIQLLNGVVFLHSHHIMHRDLKSANIFLKKNNIIKIGDLNVSKLSKNSFARTKTGTPYYLAPEVWEDRPYDYKCDIWSIGCIIYELCCLVPPFRATSLKELYRAIKTGYYLPIPKEYSNELKSVITWMLNTNPNLRKSAKEILESDIIQNKIKTGSGKALLEMINKSKNYKFMGTIKMPRNIKDLNNVLPHERYKMELNDPFETMKKTIKLIKEGNDQSDKKPLNNYNRELAEQIKNKNNNRNLNNNNINNNNDNNNNNKLDIKPIIIKSESKNNYGNKYELFNKNKNDVNIVNLNLNANNNIKKNDNNKNIVNNSKNSFKKNNNMNINESKKNSIKQDNLKISDSKQIGPNTRKKLEKQKFNEIKNEFKNNRPLSNKKIINQNRRQQNIQNNINSNNKPKPRPPSGQPRYNPSYNIRLNNDLNKNNNNNNKIKSNNLNYNNKNNNINNNNNKISQNKQKRPLSQYNNRVLVNNNMNNNNIYINNNNNYYYLNNNHININNNNNKIKKYEIKNHLYNYEGQKFDMKPYKMKANYNKMDIYKYKEENKNKFNPYLYRGNINNNNNYNYNVKYNVYYHHMKAQRERVNPAQKQKEFLFQRDGKYRKY